MRKQPYAACRAMNSLQLLPSPSILPQIPQENVEAVARQKQPDADLQLA